jgi:hypothetical protein
MGLILILSAIVLLVTACSSAPGGAVSSGETSAGPASQAEFKAALCPTLASVDSVSSAVVKLIEAGADPAAINQAIPAVQSTVTAATDEIGRLPEWPPADEARGLLRDGVTAYSGAASQLASAAQSGDSSAMNSADNLILNANSVVGPASDKLRSLVGGC